MDSCTLPDIVCNISEREQRRLYAGLVPAAQFMYTVMQSSFQEGPGVSTCEVMIEKEYCGVLMDPGDCGCIRFASRAGGLVVYEYEVLATGFEVAGHSRLRPPIT